MRSPTASSFSHALRRSRAFSLMELLVALAVVILLAGLLMVAVNAVRAKSHTATCISHQRQLWVLLRQYATDNGNRLPYYATNVMSNWSRDLTLYLHPSGSEPREMMHNGYRYPALPIMFCPAHKRQKVLRGMVTATDYAVNVWVFWDGRNTTPRRGGLWTAFSDPARTLMLLDGDDNTQGNNAVSAVVSNIATLRTASPYVGPVHQGKANLLFMDGHVEGRAFPDGTSDVQYHQDPAIGQVLR